MTRSSAKVDAQTTEAPSSDAGNPIVSALHQMAVSVLGEQLRQMFEKADDILFDSAEKARGGDEQRLYLDTMRIVRVQRSKIIDAFQQSLTDALSRIAEPETTDKTNVADIDDITQWSLQDGDALEERIAVSNMESKASSLHAHELVELQRRLSRLAQLSGGSMSPDAMSPARIIRAFQSSVRDLQVDFPIKLVIYKLFDRVVVGRLSEVFVGANQLLAVHGIEPSDTGSDDVMSESLAHAAEAPFSAAANAATLDPMTLGGFGAAAMMGNAGTMAAAQQMSGGAGLGAVPMQGMPQQVAWAQGMGAGAAVPGLPMTAYSDALLSQDIAQILSAYAQGQTPTQAHQWLPPQNVALVARMFDGYYRDPRLPDAYKQLLSRLQMPVLKTALSDPSFFSNPAHPARRAPNELFDMLLQFGSGEAAASPQVVSDVQGLVDELVRTFNLDPARLAEANAPSVDDEMADSFLRDQERLQQQKNRAKIERIRRIVAHEIRRRVGDRQLPAGVMRLLLSGFGPLLCLDYIRNGVEGASWNHTMMLVDRVLESLVSSAGSESSAGRSELITTISRRLSSIGFSDEKMQDVIDGLLGTYDDLDAAVPASSEVDAPTEVAAVKRLTPEQELLGLLGILLVPGGWFTLWDAHAKAKHWVRVKAYYPAQNSVLFSHYMEERFLRLRASAFATALIDERAHAIDPAPELQNAIARLGELNFERVSDTLQWTAADGKPIVQEATSESAPV